MWHNSFRFQLKYTIFSLATVIYVLCLYILLCNCNIYLIATLTIQIWACDSPYTLCLYQVNRRTRLIHLKQWGISEPNPSNLWMKSNRYLQQQPKGSIAQASNSPLPVWATIVWIWLYLYERGFRCVQVVEERVENFSSIVLAQFCSRLVPEEGNVQNIHTVSI